MHIVGRLCSAVIPSVRSSTRSPECNRQVHCHAMHSPYMEQLAVSPITGPWWPIRAKYFPSMVM